MSPEPTTVPLHVLQAHNYHVGRGGSEVFFEATVALLRERGHEVTLLTRDNADLTTLRQKIAALGSSVYSRRVYQQTRELLDRCRPDLAHFTISIPCCRMAPCGACRDRGIPVILTCHDYKLTCPAAQHFSGGQVCERCLGGREYWSLLKNCRKERLLSAAYALRNIAARRRGWITSTVARLIAPSEFMRQQLIKGGYADERIRVVPHFSPLVMPADSEVASPAVTEPYFAYVGRISSEKGLETLLAAARKTGYAVRIAGDPSGRPDLAAEAPHNVSFLGPLARHSLPKFYRGAIALVVPSIWYEVFGIVCLEAQSHGCPVIASCIGGLPEAVGRGQHGLLFPPGDSSALAGQMHRLWNDAGLRARLSTAGRQAALDSYRPARHYEQLMAVYREVVTLPAAASAVGASA